MECVTLVRLRWCETLEHNAYRQSRDRIGEEQMGDRQYKGRSPCSHRGRSVVGVLRVKTTG